jgi:hypothetical protein
VSDEADAHRIFFTGTAVDGPAASNPGAPLTQTYADEDASGLPVGLSDAVVAVAGTGPLTATLRHMPPVNDVAVPLALSAAWMQGAPPACLSSRAWRESNGS